MLMHRRSQERGEAIHGWLHSFHTFSFAGYYDQAFMGVSDLRVINEDRIAGGSGFGEHPHRDMEIISYVVSGALKHRDSMGNETVIRPGEVQVMSAGTGVVHSEMNFFPDQETHFFQIWIIPGKAGLKPGYGQRSFEQELQTQKLTHVISPDGLENSISINQDANVYILRLEANEIYRYPCTENRCYWIQLIHGKVEMNNLVLHPGDGVFSSHNPFLDFKATEPSELMLFDLREK